MLEGTSWPLPESGVLTGRANRGSVVGTVLHRLTGLDVSVANQVLLIAYVFPVGNTLFNVRLFLESFGSHLQNIVELSFRNDAVDGGQFQQQWTIFYWAW
ncbi:MAG: hypothetical protein EA417_07870 [Gammaproteobacteria bacterium]|nr:MAG: hypothetical protein EA417_07870 [Gammaproteobacteria bacterium]